MPSCVELGNCAFNEPLTVFLEPYRALVGDFIFIIVWGIVIGIFWLRTQNAEYTGLLGIFISSALIASGVTIVPEALWIGVLLLGISIGIALYNLFTKRLFA